MHPLALPLLLASQTSLPVDALVYSTMPSTFAHRPELAMDGDANTSFRSYYGMGDGDSFTVILGRPIPVRSLRVTTGAGENDLLTDATLETSVDGTKFIRAADFDAKGIAATNRVKDPVMAIRIRMKPSKAVSRLQIKEIDVDSPVVVGSVLRGPGRGFVDVSRAPDLAEWAAIAEGKMRSYWLETAAILYSDGFVTPNAVHVVYRSGKDVTPVAAAGGGVMTVNADYARKNPNDTGLVVHEAAHIIQSGGSPGWLVEAVADYVRWVTYEPQNFTYNINVQTATSHDPYRTGAAFLGWLALHYDPKLVTKLNHATRFGTYKDELFERYCGKPMEELWKEFLAAYQKDKANLLVPPVPPAMRPRELPKVTGKSTTVHPFFNNLGITADGAKFPANGGFDDGGAALSKNLLKDEVVVQGVKFQVGSGVLSAPGRGMTISGKHRSLWLLGAAIDGGQRDQVVTVTYTDGTKAEFHQNFSDWFEPQDFPGEVRAVKMPYRNLADGTRDSRPFYAYAYGFPLDATKEVANLEFPKTPNLRILAITLAD
ncbi:MAG: basic secretory protein-like protein [Fimbriimonas sp.]